MKCSCDYNRFGDRKLDVSCETHIQDFHRKVMCACYNCKPYCLDEHATLFEQKPKFKGIEFPEYTVHLCEKCKNTPSLTISISSKHDGNKCANCGKPKPKQNPLDEKLEQLSAFVGITSVSYGGFLELLKEFRYESFLFWVQEVNKYHKDRAEEIIKENLQIMGKESWIVGEK